MNTPKIKKENLTDEQLDMVTAGEVLSFSGCSTIKDQTECNAAGCKWYSKNQVCSIS